MTRRRVATVLVAAALTATAAISALVIGPQAVDMCVQHWENSGGGGDTIAIGAPGTSPI